MTPRIPRGWVLATERGEGVWCDYVGNGWRRAMERGPLLPERTYIVRTDPSVPADPNECLRIEDEAARLVEPKPDHIPDAGQMVPGMMLVRDLGICPVWVPVASLTWQPHPAGHTQVWSPCQGEADEDDEDAGGWIVDKRTPAEFAAAYTAAWEYTERRRAEIAEEVRRGGAPTTEPDLGEWPGRPEVPPGTRRDVLVLTAHGPCRAYFDDFRWRVYVDDDENCAQVHPVDVLAWRELPLAIVADRRVTGVTRG